MNRLNKAFMVLVMVVFANTTNAQVLKQPDTAITGRKTAVRPPVVKKPIVKKPKPLHAELGGGFKITTNGWGVFMDKGWVQSEDKMRDYFYDTKLLQVELTEKKDPKELKKSNTLSTISDPTSNSYIYGKKNNFYALKAGYGKRKMIAGKPEQGNISIHWVYLGGLSMGMLKPYYLQTTSGIIKYSDENAARFLTQQQNIVGSAGFSKGLNEIQAVPGAYLKTALHFDFAAAKTTKLAIETGVNFEYYSKDIEIMAAQGKYRPYLLDLYIAIQFGKRW